MVSGCNMFSNGHCILGGLCMGALFLSMTDKCLLKETRSIVSSTAVSKIK